MSGQTMQPGDAARMEAERSLMIKLGKEALYYRDEQARQMVEASFDDPSETERIEAWTQLYLNWGMRLRVYAEIAVKLGLYKDKADYNGAIMPVKEGTVENDH